MATLTDFLSYEQQKPTSEVRLYAEWLLCKAYEQSAYYLATECGLKPVKRRSKQLQRDYVTAGFPKTPAPQMDRTGAPSADGNGTIKPTINI